MYTYRVRLRRSTPNSLLTYGQPHLGGEVTGESGNKLASVPRKGTGAFAVFAQSRDGS